MTPTPEMIEKFKKARAAMIVSYLFLLEIRNIKYVQVQPSI